jgi:hypothetical protein
MLQEKKRDRSPGLPVVQHLPIPHQTEQWYNAAQHVIGFTVARQLTIFT